MAQGLMYYLLVLPGGEEVNAKINPSTLPRTTMAPNVQVLSTQLLIDPVTGYLSRPWDKFYSDGETLFFCEPSA